MLTILVGYQMPSFIHNSAVGNGNINIAKHNKHSLDAVSAIRI